MPHAELDPTGTMIRVETSYTDLQLMKMLPGARFNKPSNSWLAPRTWASCIALRGLFGAKLALGPELTGWGHFIRTERIAPAMATRNALTTDGLELTERQALALKIVDEIEGDEELCNPSRLRLYPYQRVDVAFLVANRRALLCNEPGLGKTGSVIRTLQALSNMEEQPWPVVIVCPNSLKRTVWEKELQRWAPGLTISVVDGSAAKRRQQLEPGKHVYIINYEALRLHSRQAKYGQEELTQKQREPKELNALKPGAVIFDEVHRCKDPHAQQTRSAWALAEDAKIVIGMTGTPVANHVAEAWSLLRLVEPTWFPAKTRWMDRYVQQSLNWFGGATVLGVNRETENELHKVIDPLIRRVPKTLALPQLPPKLPVQYRETPMLPAQAKAYRQMETAMVAELEGGLLFAEGLAGITRLTQFACASAQLGEPYEKNGKKVQDVRLTAPSNKVDDLLDLLEEMGDAPLVVGAVSRQLIELAAAKLDELKISHVLVTGAQSTEERKEAVDAFQAGQARVILCTLGAGAEGLTLTRADTLLFMQRSWSQVQNKQFEDRIHRIGAEHHACIRILEQITPGTIEERRVELLADKEAQAEEFLRDKATMAKLLGAKG